MTDIQAATDMEVAAAAGTTVDATREPSMPLGVIVFAAIVAFGSEALWLGLIGWWLLNCTYRLARSVRHLPSQIA